MNVSITLSKSEFYSSQTYDITTEDEVTINGTSWYENNIGTLYSGLYGSYFSDLEFPDVEYNGSKIYAIDGMTFRTYIVDRNYGYLSMYGYGCFKNPGIYIFHKGYCLLRQIWGNNQTITFNVSSPSNIRVKTSSGWQEGKAYVKTSSGWQESSDVYVKTSSGWQKNS